MTSAADKQNAKAYGQYVQEFALHAVSAALERAGFTIENQGGLVVTPPSPDGEVRRYFLRLTLAGTPAPIADEHMGLVE